MAVTCDTLIKKDISVNCEAPIVRGLEANGVIINRCDLDFSKCTQSASKKNILEAFALLTTKKGFKVYVPGKNPFNGTKTTMATGAYVNTFTNELPLVVLDQGPDVAENIIDGLANGTFVVIVENKHKGADKSGAFQVYGFYQGLSASAIENDKYSEETEGGWAVTLTEERSPKSALYLFKTDYAATKAIVDSLVATAGA